MKQSLYDDKITKYISQFPDETQDILQKIRALILDTAPLAVESISYGMPAYKLNKKPLIYFAGYKNHIGIYATPTSHSEFAKELAGYKQGKGSVQFPLTKPMPYDLIERMIHFKISEINHPQL